MTLESCCVLFDCKITKASASSTIPSTSAYCHCSYDMIYHLSFNNTAVLNLADTVLASFICFDALASTVQLHIRIACSFALQVNTYS